MIVETLIFFSIIHNLYLIKKMINDDKILYNNNNLVIFYMILLGPLLEEVMFRDFILRNMTFLPYYMEINAVMFGLIHATNYILINDKYLVITQVIKSTIVGYHFATLNNLTMCILLHMLYNSLPVIFYFVYKSLFQDKNDKIFINNSLFVLHNKHRRCISLDNKDNIVGSMIDKIPQDIQESLDKYNKYNRIKKRIVQHI